jgi:hypothetical protein
LSTLDGGSNFLGYYDYVYQAYAAALTLSVSSNPFYIFGSQLSTGVPIPVSWSVLDSKSNILTNSAPSTLQYGGRGACEWWWVNFAGTTTANAGALQMAVNVNGSTYGISQVLIGN